VVVRHYQPYYTEYSTINNIRREVIYRHILAREND
jgi:hypothetical protein